MNMHQRYISDELSHFVGKGKSRNEQYALLIKILKSGWLSFPPHAEDMFVSELSANPTRKIDDNKLFNPKMICFCDIPYQDLGIHVKKYSAFGLAFSKDFVVRKGGCPVHYIPTKSAGPGKEIFGRKFDRMARAFFVAMHAVQGFEPEYERIRDLLDMWSGGGPDVFDDDSEFHGVLFDVESFMFRHVFSYWKLFDHQLDDNHKDNYYFEREWRMLNNLKFMIDDVTTVFMPRDFAKRFRNDCPDYYGQTIFIRD